jgi:hypothetical protein
MHCAGAHPFILPSGLILSECEREEVQSDGKPSHSKAFGSGCDAFWKDSTPIHPSINPIIRFIPPRRSAMLPPLFLLP